MTKLEQIENLRQALVRQILEITNLSIYDVEVTIGFSNQDNDSELAIEARQLDWHPDRYQDSAWYTSEKPTGGSTTIYVE